MILSPKVCAGRNRTNVPTPGYNIQPLFRILPQHTVALRCAKPLELPQNGFLRGNQAFCLAAPHIPPGSYPPGGAKAAPSLTTSCRCGPASLMSPCGADRRCGRKSEQRAAGEVPLLVLPGGDCPDESWDRAPIQEDPHRVSSVSGLPRSAGSAGCSNRPAHPKSLSVDSPRRRGQPCQHPIDRNR